MRAHEFINEKVAFETNNIRLVRVQPDLRGIGRDENGVFLYRYGDNNTRNTMHFVINGVVTGHEMGDAWKDAGVVIIADPKQIQGQMAGTRLEDTWYHLDENGRLYLGNPTILAPAGIQNPENIPVKQYSGDRNSAITEYLKSVGIKSIKMGRDSAVDIDRNDSDDTVKDIIRKYGIEGETTQDSHFNTIEAWAESIVDGCKLQLDRAQKESWMADAEDIMPGMPSGSSRTQVVQYSATDTIERINNYLKSNPTMARRVGPYFQKIIKQLQDILQQIPEINQRYQNASWSFLMPDGNRTPAKSREDIMKAALTYAQSYPQYINHVHVVKNWPHEGKPYEDRGTIAQVYSKQINQMQQQSPAMPPPISQQQQRQVQPPPINQSIR